MTFITLIEYGNKKNHLIPLENISNFAFGHDKEYSKVYFMGGGSINVIENELDIRQKLKSAKVKIVG